MPWEPTFPSFLDVPLLLGKREDPWLSGTMNAFTVLLFGNSHTRLNFRVPLCEETHDNECVRNCLNHATLQKLQCTMQQATGRATRYFTEIRAKASVGKKDWNQRQNKKALLCTRTETKDPGAPGTTAKSRAPCVWRPRVQMFGSFHHRRVHASRFWLR